MLKRLFTHILVRAGTGKRSEKMGLSLYRVSASLNETIFYFGDLIIAHFCH